MKMKIYNDSLSREKSYILGEKMANLVIRNWLVKRKNTTVHYKYTYSHPQTDCFVAPQPTSVARHPVCFKLGLKPAQFYIRLSIIALCHQLTYVSLGIIRHYVIAFACLHFTLPDTRALNLFEENDIALEAAVNFLDGLTERERERERERDREREREIL